MTLVAYGLKGRILVVAEVLGPQINFGACLWVLIRHHHITVCRPSFQLKSVTSQHETCDALASEYQETQRP